MVRFTKAGAMEFLGIDKKQFENFYSKGAEFDSTDSFNKEKLIQWKKDYDARNFTLSPDEYAKCLDFALAIHFRGYSSIDFGSPRQREFGQKVANWVRGQLGELGFAHFCRERLGFEIKLDFEMHKQIVPQDVIAIVKNGVKVAPQNRIAVKATKHTNVSLVLGRNEVELPSRQSDVYVFVRVNLPDDHLLRIGRREIIKMLKNQQHYQLYKNKIEELKPIQTEIAGFAYRQDLELSDKIPGYRFESERYVKLTGHLRRSLSEWKQAIR
jgi:hypothetical protein